MERALSSAEIHESIGKFAASGYVLDIADSLFEDGAGLDSMAFLELMLELESLSGGRIRGHLTEDAIESINSFTEFVINATKS